MYASIQDVAPLLARPAEASSRSRTCFSATPGKTVLLTALLLLGIRPLLKHRGLDMSLQQHMSSWMGLVSASSSDEAKAKPPHSMLAFVSCTADAMAAHTVSARPLYLLPARRWHHRTLPLGEEVVVALDELWDADTAVLELVETLVVSQEGVHLR